jgi:hypothetical protein
VWLQLGWSLVSVITAWLQYGWSIGYSVVGAWGLVSVVTV